MIIKRRYAFQNKLTIYNATLIAAIILICSIFFYAYLLNKAKKQIEYDVKVLTDSIDYDFNSLLETNDKTILRLAANKELIDVFSSIPKSQTNYFTDNVQESVLLTKIIQPYTFINDDIGRLYVYTMNNDFYSTGKLACTNECVEYFLKSKKTKEVSEYLNDIDSYKFLSYPSKDILSPVNYNTNNSKLFSITRPIFDYTSFSKHVIGYITIEQPTDVIDELLSYMPKGTIAYMVDGNNQSFYTYSKNIAYANRIFLDVVDGEEIKNYYVSKTEENSFGFYIYLLIPTKESDLYLKKTAIYLFSGVLFFVFFIFLTEKAMIKKLTLPLQELSQSISTVNLDNLSIDLDEHKEFDELKQINAAFNRMGEELKNSVDEKVKSETSTLQAQLLALQSQLNPHFFHNILTIISVMADDNKNDSIVEICTKLSSMLRFSSSYTSLTCLLEEELTHTENYLSLMKIRYEDMFTYKIKVEDDLKNITIPKYIFQPLAENCFNHGFKQTLPPWHIDIVVTSDNDNWKMIITDNGGKFTDEALEKFNFFINNFSIKNTQSALHELSIGGLCLCNIYIRLKLLYKDNSIFEIDNSNKGKTIITIGGKKHV